MIKRRKTRKVKVGNVEIGGDSLISVQSMTNTDTKDVAATVQQIKELEAAGCEIVRVGLPDMESAKCIGKIKEQISIPLVADIHFDYEVAIESINQGVDKIRINPGNIGGSAESEQERKDRVKQIIDRAKEKNIPIRIGINSGSLEKDLLKKYNEKVTPEGLVESAQRSIELVEEFGFKDIVVALKSSDVVTAVAAYEMLAEKGDWPLHLGITESGRATTGIVKSSMGIGGLLLKGIGDTIRVSLSGSPIEEVKVGWEILKNLGLRQRGLVLVSCPTCARTNIPVEKIAIHIESLSERFGKKPIKIAVMGCVVNGLGEARDADIAIVGMHDKEAAIFKKGKLVQKIDPKDIESVLEKVLF
ncbi:flavodoxin-dependent (E)-4-hydroxy-3-methylbut-2-enyl-diphosphate synthase [Patescibacteria group bacterium]